MIKRIRLNNIIKDKKGFLLAEETLKIILAIIAIGFLAYLLFSLYMANKNSEDLKLAEASLNFLTGEINAQKTEAEIYNPEDWVINSWPNSYETGALFWKSNAQGIPLSCSNLGWQSCICICEGNSPEDCDETGICSENKESFQFQQPIKIENPPVKIIIDHQNKRITRG